MNSDRHIGPIFLPIETLDSETALRFTRNDNNTYRKLVTAIWNWLHPPSPDSQRVALLPSADPRLKLGRSEFSEAFEIMCELVDTVNSFGDHTNDMQKNSAFWGILHNSHYQKWKNQDHGLLRIVNSSDPELIPSGPDTVSIPPPVKPSQWNLRAFCRSLSHHHTDHQVLHLDFEAMATNCGPRRRQWTVNNLIGPLILRIFKAAVENTSETIDPLEFLCKHLNKNVNLVPSPEDKGEVTPFDRLILLTQELGSAMVHVIGNSLDDYYKMFPSDPESPPSDWENYACNMTDSCTPRPLMLILNGLDVLEPSPELGRLVYCISQLHEYINQGRDCKLLVTHKNRSDLDGLLKSFHCLKDNEYRGRCLRFCFTG